MPLTPLRWLTPVLLALIAGVACAEDTFTIAFKDHRIVPPELVVPAGKKIKLVVDNQDATPEEFESHSRIG